jgi:anti-anti-sigma factor
MGWDAKAEGFRLEVGDDVVLHLAGELDLAVKEQLSSALASARVDGRPLVLDLTDVTFLDSSGLAVLLEANRDPAGVLRLRGVGLAVRLTLEAAGVADVLTIEG